ncbi:MAG: hypothetical protein HYZ14_13165 [Bacteroidetes bacterium]|nr:hypothetical protein [Bacteroidota bacterium]
MKKFILLFALLTAAFTSQAKTMETVEETEALSVQVTTMFKDQLFHEAFGLLAKYWPIPQNEIDLLEEKTIKAFNMVKDRYGDVIDYVRVRKEVIAGDLATRETYLLRFENIALRLIFTYYRNDKGWIVNAFKWDDSFDEEFRTVE